MKVGEAPPASARDVARAFAAAVGAGPTFARMADAQERQYVDLASAADRPRAGLSTHITLTLHADTAGAGANPVELIGVAPTGLVGFADLLSTCALFVVNDGWLPNPGGVFEDVVRHHHLSPRLDHVLWATPARWPELVPPDLGQGLGIRWMLAVPISESERQLRRQIGHEAFLARMVAEGLDVADLGRPEVRGGRRDKAYRLGPDAIRPLAPGHGGCLATDRITVEGSRVGYMYREPPDNDVDSGWRFTAGDERQAEMDDPGRSGVFDVNTIANLDPEIIPFLDAPIGSVFVRWPPGGPLGPEPTQDGSGIGTAR